MHPLKKFLTECLTASGRLSRLHYARLIFMNCLPVTVAMILEWLIVTALELGARFPHTVTFVRVIMYSTGIFSAITIPCLTARRLHDIGKSGWFGWIPFLSPLFPCGILISVFLVWWLASKDGDASKNKYGDPPPDD